VLQSNTFKKFPSLGLNDICCEFSLAKVSSIKNFPIEIQLFNLSDRANCGAGNAKTRYFVSEPMVDFKITSLIMKVAVTQHYGV
jgi:hypothetical protein